MTTSNTADSLLSHAATTNTPASNSVGDTKKRDRDSNSSAPPSAPQSDSLTSLSSPNAGSKKWRVAGRAQREEIVKHRDKLVRRSGRSVSLDDAAKDWIKSFAAEWRAKFEARWRSHGSRQ